MSSGPVCCFVSIIKRLLCPVTHLRNQTWQVTFIPRYRWGNVCTANSPPTSWQGDNWDVVVTVNTFCLFPPFLSLAKTEHKAEMEVSTTTKVKVTDFFQRLVCGLLIFFHSHYCFFLHCGCLIHQVTWNGSGYVFFKTLEVYLFLKHPEFIFCYFWIQPTKDESPGCFGTFEPIWSPLLLPKRPGLSSKTKKQN